MADSSQEKTENATPKKLREARKKGQVAKSRDLTTVVVLIFVFITMCFAIAWMGSTLKESMTAIFKLSSHASEGASLLSAGKLALLTIGKVLAPVLLVGFIFAYVGGFAQVGALFATDTLKPNIKKLNIIEGFKNLFKTQTFIELFKTIIKIVAIFTLAYFTLKGELENVLNSAQNENLADTVGLTGNLLYKFLLRVLVLFLIVAVIDYAIQRQQFMKQQKMSKDEVKREYKQDEGDPMIKGARKQLHREMVFGDVQQNVKTADAVVTNPTHVAIAIKYDQDEMYAPEIVAKGQKEFANKIRSIAEEHEVPIIRNVPLAWALNELEEGDEVPEELFNTVAEILSYVYRLREGLGSEDEAFPEVLS